MSKPLFDSVCEEHVFSTLYERWSKDLHDFIYYKYGDHLNPEDKVHEAFMKLWQNCKKVAPDKAKSFLFTVINNITLNDIKHQKVVLKYQEVKQPDRTSITPEFLMEENQYMQKFNKALAKLPEGQRVAFMLNRAEGKRHKEIAEMLNISRKAVEKRIYTALKTLQKELDELK